MKITKVSTLTGIIHTREIPVTAAQLLKWDEGELIQNAMPNLSPDDREFLMSGITPEEWKAEFGGEEPSDDLDNYLDFEAQANRVDGYDHDDLGESPDF